MQNVACCVIKQIPIKVKCNPKNFLFKNKFKQEPSLIFGACNMGASKTITL